MDPSEAPEPERLNPTELGAFRSVQARHYGWQMIRIGIVICVLSALGLQFQFGQTGTLLVGGVALAVGLGALVASLSPRSANLATFLVQTALWTVIVALILIVLASIVGFVYFLVAAFK
jgi:hypothetical protein